MTNNQDNTKPEPCCDQYQRGIEQINGFIMIAGIHHCGPYTMPPFRFCPWCGTKQKEQPVVPPTVEVSTREEMFQKAAMVTTVPVVYTNSSAASTIIWGK